MPMNNKPNRRPKVDPHVTAEPPWWAEENERGEIIDRLIRESGGAVDANAPDASEPRPDEAINRLRSLPLHLATKQARDWTGRDDIHTLDEAIAAVTDALKQD